MLIENNSNYISCELQNDGTARLVSRISGDYVDIGNFIQTGFESNGSMRITQKAIIKDHNVKYYVNDEFVQELDLNSLKPFYLGLRICGKQAIAYDHLIIKTYE